MPKIYYIKNNNSGMAAMFNTLVMALEQILGEPGSVPVVDWISPNYSDYGESENIWNRYFQFAWIPQIQSGTEYENVEVRGWCVPAKGNDYRNKYNKIFQKHIVVNPSIVDKVDKIFKSTSTKPCIGVHIRNTDRQFIHGDISPPPLTSVSHHLKLCLESYKKNGNSEVNLFIASDNVPDAEELKISVREFSLDNGMIVNLLEDPETIRSPNTTTSVHGTHDSGLQSVANSKKAESILVDIFSLARCETIVRVCSNVSVSSAIINPKAKIIDVSLACGKFSEDWISE